MAGPVLPLSDVVRTVRRQRITLGLTQAELAKASKTSQSLIAKLEKGRISASYDVVRRILEALDRAAANEEEEAGDIMGVRPIFAEPAEPLGAALARMKQHGFSQLPVVDRGQPIGSVSESAILDHIDKGADLEALKRQPVRFVMRPSFPTVEPSTRRRTLVELLRDHEAVLVVREGRLVGVVTKSDLW
ncbi:MAG TPA: CBS domain-containing protein [Candidatus Thermoplasmatota archaeon]|nr:CBS domain-containing protein [Candidatus Thermoplasmatota archaeon]